MVWAVNGSAAVVCLTVFAHLGVVVFDLYIEVSERLEGILDLFEVVELAGPVEELKWVPVIVVTIFCEGCARAISKTVIVGRRMSFQRLWCHSSSVKRRCSCSAASSMWRIYLSWFTYCTQA